MAIMAIVAAISIPAIFALTNSNKLNSVASELQGMLEQARQYAVAQNTYVWVAFNTQTNSSNVDTVSVAVIASADGSDPGTYGTVPSSSYTLISRIRTFPQIVLQSPSYTGITLPTTGTESTNPAAPANAMQTLTTAFNIQLPGASTATTFTQALIFSPSGAVRNSTSPIDFVEFVLEPAMTHSNPNAKNVAFMRVNGLTGQTIVYRQ